MFIIKTTRKNSSVTINNDEGVKIATLKSGSSITLPDEVMAKCVKSIRGLLSISPSVITVNKEIEKKEVINKVEVKKEVKKAETKTTRSRVKK